MKALRWPVALLTAAGLALALWTLGSVGFAEIARALAGLGIGGFLLFLAAYLLVVLALGAAWASSTDDRSRPFWVYAWARTVREAGNDLLPFSQLGGLLLGFKVLAGAGLPLVRIYAATIIDLTTEMVSQLLLVLTGLAVAAMLLQGRAVADTSGLAPILWVGGLGMVALTLLFVLLQRPALTLAAKLAAKLLPAAQEMIDDVRAELVRFGERPAAMLPSFLWNVAAWLLSVFSVWLACRLLGSPIGFMAALALEALISVLRSGVFFMPGALGVQEAGYAFLAPLVGLDREAALALALLKRGRDVVFGVPTLLAWQWTLIRGR